MVVNMYEIQTQEFSGPLDALLTLIESKKMDVTRMSVAAVTADFISYVASLKEKKTHVSPRVLADFLSVAAHLLVLKSKALLPRLELDDEEDEVFDLEHRLEVYKACKRIFDTLTHTWNNASSSYAREFLSSQTPMFYPPPSCNTETLCKALDRVLGNAASFLQETHTVRNHVISLESKIEELSKKIFSGGSFSFASVLGNKPREEVVVLFLALLHILRDQSFFVKQSETFGDIQIHKE